ncbi:hypothetical protein PMIT1342_00363 [Prochlorococcus marinus str. MIT 1342]|uniref:hypothetical protein n=1 Tax=Prochlorococcus marinus TaxID=1219 RepID=UPI0007BB1B17|nr:hypothetical protein [Prochlorococcus marinus]KZR83571.1 hypothetical protein PMIT1342_00363 [Prochlorococcus marinus str. MIT 1342]
MAATSNQPDNECPFKRSIPVQCSLRLSLSLAFAWCFALAVDGPKFIDSYSILEA